VKQKIIAFLLVFLGGFAVMVLEIVGVRFLAKDFGGGFYVWTSQIGMVLVALALGYLVGGRLADRYQRAGYLIWLLLPAGLFVLFIPDFAQKLIDWIVERHPEGEIPAVWMKLDPAIGSGVIFLLPCLALATLAPFMTRLMARRVSHVGTVSGLIYAASTVGSIAGVFGSAYLLIDMLEVPSIFRLTGGLTLGLCGLCCLLDHWTPNGLTRERGK
jgi:MFS family permease